MINSVALTGRITKDIELRKTQSNISVTSFTLAVDNGTKDANGNSTTTFVTCNAWRGSAEFLSNYAHKGSLIGVEGKLLQRNFVRKDGTNASVLEVSVTNVTLLEKKADGTNSNTTIDNVPPIEEEVSDITTNDNAEDDFPF